MGFFFKPLTDITGRHFLITGGSQGIGKAIAKEVARLGANVTIVARRENVLSDAKLEIEYVNKNIQVATISADLSSKDNAAAAISKAENIAPVDYIVFSHGMAYPGMFDELPVEEFENGFKVNYFSSLYMLKALVPKMKVRGKGHIVFIGSALSHFSFLGYSQYSPAKHAISGLAETLLNELSNTGIKVSIGYPDDTMTPGYELEEERKPEVCKHISKKLGSVSTPEKVARGFVKCMRKEYFHLYHNFDIFMLQAYCGGMTPRPHPLLSALVLPFVHIYSIWISTMLPKWAKVIKGS
jgi:3-dehydrosphinganine reductase